MAEVVVLANGMPLSGWLEVHIDQAHDKVAGQATVKYTEQPANPLPMKLGDKCQVLIDGRPVVTGHVHEVDGELDEHSHTINATARDKAQDFIDSTVGPKLKLKPPISLKKMTEQTLQTMGLGDIGVIDNIGPDDFKEGEQMSASIDEHGFDFIDKWAQRRQVLMNSDGKGNIVIDRNRKQRAPAGAALICLNENSAINNVLKSKYRNSDLNRSNKTAVNGQKSTNDKDHWQSKAKGEATGQANPLQKNWGTADDTSIRPQRRRHMRGSQGLSGGTPKKAAKWRSNEAKARGFQYTATVQGFYGAPGWLWWHGFLVMVSDPHWELECELLITDVRFKKTWKGGEITELTCTYPDAWTTDEEGQAKATGRTSKLGMGASGPGDYEPVSDADAGLEDPPT
jgi:prophage tail gpP-like protein